MYHDERVKSIEHPRIMMFGSAMVCKNKKIFVFNDLKNKK